ncbi:hypothetical protein BV918_08280 [Pectobacterium odoriferum]|nr:hypothetical protein BCS7_11655 [Pectobacterium odoriferum]POE18955.1 hypothetical protein BV918_08280 [Pectobacterium odoriferum]POE35824.1 hypothetical protein BV922_08265 [Pectobacterium odoriferum]
MYIFLLRIKNETEFSICTTKPRVTAPKKQMKQKLGCSSERKMKPFVATVSLMTILIEDYSTKRGRYHE